MPNRLSKCASHPNIDGSLLSAGFRRDIIMPTDQASLSGRRGIYSEGTSAREIAVELFLRFLLNPYNDKLGGPCKYCDE